MMTNALKRMKEKFIDIEYDDLSDTDEVEINKDIEATKALLTEISSKKDSAMGNSNGKIEL